MHMNDTVYSSTSATCKWVGLSTGEEGDISLTFDGCGLFRLVVEAGLINVGMILFLGPKSSEYFVTPHFESTGASDFCCWLKMSEVSCSFLVSNADLTLLLGTFVCSSGIPVPGLA